jgi:hypothetical protein
MYTNHSNLAKVEDVLGMSYLRITFYHYLFIKHAYYITITLFIYGKRPIGLIIYKEKDKIV